MEKMLKCKAKVFDKRKQSITPIKSWGSNNATQTFSPYDT